ncbi:MAG: hypothetical protein QOE62_2887, partial [Actinomycetota bacterium]|nr:hypothetical protein [Actinomycetota bacterium]
ASRCTRSTTNERGYSAQWTGLQRNGNRPGPEVASTRAESVPANPSDHAPSGVSTRTYIVLAAITGLVILVAFATQVLLVHS